MRLQIRLAGGIAMIFGVVSCSAGTEGVTASRSSSGSPARVAINPSFSPAAASAFSALSASGTDITDIHIVVTDLGGRVTLDTVVVFPITKDSIAIDLPLSIQGREEQFIAQIDLRDAAGIVQFSIRQRVTARGAGLPRVPTPPLVLQYVGPGSTAKTIAVSPGDGTLVPGATMSLIATGADAAGVPLGNLNVVWTSSDTTIAQVTPTGPASALVRAVGPRGVATVTARSLSGISGAAKVTVVPTAAGLSVVAGAGQTKGTLDTLPVPFTVELRASDGGPISGVLVTFSAVTKGGDVVTTNAPTDASGRASTRVILGRDVGSYTFRAASGSLAPVTLSATATLSPIGPPAQLIPLTPLPANFKAGVTASQKFSAQLADAKGYYVRQAGVVMTARLDITNSSGVTSRRDITATSDADGVITLTIPAFESPGSVLITIGVADLGLTLSGTFTIN